MTTLYEQLGGQAAISSVVDKFYQFMMVDPIIKPFFEKTDMVKQHKAQKAFITMITGGPNNYEGADMKKAHQGMNIGKKEFDATWFHLNQSLTHHKVPEALIKQVYEAFYSFEADIVQKKQ